MGGLDFTGGAPKSRKYDTKEHDASDCYCETIFPSSSPSLLSFSWPQDDWMVAPLSQQETALNIPTSIIGIRGVFYIIFALAHIMSLVADCRERS